MSDLSSGGEAIGIFAHCTLETSMGGIASLTWWEGYLSPKPSTSTKPMYGMSSYFPFAVPPVNSSRETTVFERSTPLVQEAAAGDTRKTPFLRARAFMTKDFPLLAGPKIVTKFRGLEGKESITVFESGWTTTAPCSEGSEDVDTHLVDRLEGSSSFIVAGYIVLSREASSNCPGPSSRASD